uniref:Uncharacterized protein n=1 Tax=Oryza brachyantha TaxID=4533 RepID=J3N1Q2_ORYBR
MFHELSSIGVTGAALAAGEGGEVGHTVHLVAEEAPRRAAVRAAARRRRHQPRRLLPQVQRVQPRVRLLRVHVGAGRQEDEPALLADAPQANPLHVRQRQQVVQHHLLHLLPPPLPRRAPVVAVVAGEDADHHVVVRQASPNLDGAETPVRRDGEPAVLHLAAEAEAELAVPLPLRWDGLGGRLQGAHVDAEHRIPCQPEHAAADGHTGGHVAQALAADLDAGYLSLGAPGLGVRRVGPARREVAALVEEHQAEGGGTRLERICRVLEIVGGEQRACVVPRPVLPGEDGEDGHVPGHGVAHDEPEGGGARGAAELEDEAAVP